MRAAPSAKSRARPTQVQGRRPGASFCRAIVRPTLIDMQLCPNCGEENPAKFRLCGFCGTPLAPAVPAQEVRKLVTILFCDLKGSTSLGERLDSESLRETMSRYFDSMSAEITR